LKKKEWGIPEKKENLRGLGACKVSVEKRKNKNIGKEKKREAQKRDHQKKKNETPVNVETLKAKTGYYSLGGLKKKKPNNRNRNGRSKAVRISHSSKCLAHKK